MNEDRQPSDPNRQHAARASVENESPEEIRSDIAQTRVEMSGTIDAIQEKLNPDRLKEQVTSAVQEHVETVKENIRDATVGRAEQMVSNVGDSAQRAGSGFVETIKQNPIPAALAALGIGWLWTKRSGGSSGGQYRPNGGRTYDAGSQPSYGRGQAQYGADQEGDDQSLGDRVGNMTGEAKDKVSDVTGQAKDTVTDVASQAKDRVGQFADQAQDQAGKWGGQVQSGARQAKSRFDQTMHENPLAVSAAAVAVGLAVGLSLPDTPLEDKLLGEARDSVMEKAQATTQETMQKVGQVAQQVQQTATETAKDAAQKQGLTTGSSQQGSQQSNQQRPTANAPKQQSQPSAQQGPTR